MKSKPPGGSVRIAVRAGIMVCGLALVVAGCTSEPSTSGPQDSSGAVVDQDDAAAGTEAAPLPSPVASVDPNASPAGRLPGEPDPSLTPGVLNLAVSQATISSTICVSGWTATIRPPSSFTSPLKIQQIAMYAYPDANTADYEEDHLIPLQLGGAPSDTANLWPEPYLASLPDGKTTGARVKDAFETALKRAVCGGTMTLSQAQSEIGIHWVHAFYGIPLASGP